MVRAKWKYDTKSKCEYLISNIKNAFPSAQKAFPKLTNYNYFTEAVCTNRNNWIPPKTINLSTP